MSFWVDKYRPTSLQKLDYHKTQATHLKNLVNQGDFPHLLVHGPSGAGKKTRIMCLLRELYGAGVERLRMENMTFATPSNKKVEIMTVSSNYHIELNPSDAGIYDRIVVQDLIKNVATSGQLDSSGQREFKVVVLSEVDQLTKEAQHALRRTMEKYVASCRLILCANSTSRVIPAIKSRCLGIRVAAPTQDEIESILRSICQKENITLPPELATRIAIKSERNLRRAILALEDCKVQHFPMTPTQEVFDPSWKVFIREMCGKIVQQQSPTVLFEARTQLYELVTRGIPSDVVFRGMLEELVKNCDVQMKTQIVAHAAVYEHRMRQGSKTIYHLEAFVAKFMAVYKRYMEESLGGFVM